MLRAAGNCPSSPCGFGRPAFVFCFLESINTIIIIIKLSIWVDVVFYYCIQRWVIGAISYGPVLFAPKEQVLTSHWKEYQWYFASACHRRSFVTSCMLCMFVLYILYVHSSLSSVLRYDWETWYRYRPIIHHPSVWIRSAAANVFPKTEEYASTQRWRLGSRNINASFCSGVKSVLRAAGKAEAGAGDLPTRSPVKEN